MKYLYLNADIFVYVFSYVILSFIPFNADIYIEIQMF